MKIFNLQLYNTLLIIKIIYCYCSSDIIPRSVLMVEMGETYYLLCALGDGCLYYYTLNHTNGR